MKIFVDKISNFLEGFVVLARLTLVIFLMLFFIKVLVLSLNSTEERYTLEDRTFDLGSQTFTESVGPKRVTSGVVKYNVVNGDLLVSSFATLYNYSKEKDCVVRDRRNWSCTWEGLEGAVVEERMLGGKYDIFNTRWTFDEITTENAFNDVSLLRYQLVGCKSHFYDSILEGIFACPIIFAFNYP